MDEDSINWQDFLDGGDPAPSGAPPALRSSTEHTGYAGQSVFASAAGQQAWAPPARLEHPDDGPIAIAEPSKWRSRTGVRRGIVGVSLAIVLAIGVVVGIVQSQPPSRPSLAGDTAAQVLSVSMGNVRRAGSFEIVANGLISGSSSPVVVNLEPDGATFEENVTGTQLQAAIEGGTVLVRAPALFWSGFLGVDASRATVLARWIEVPGNRSDIQAITRMLSFGGSVANLLELGRPELAGKPSGNQSAPISIRGTLPNTLYNRGAGAGQTALLEVSPTAPFYPIQLTVPTVTGKATYHFKDFGDKWPLPPVTAAVPLSTVVAQSRIPATTPLVPLTAPTPTGSAPPGSVPIVTGGSTLPGVSVDVPEATTVASQLWRGLMTARHYRDPAGLARVESGSSLAVDREICLAGCPPPPLLTMSGIQVVVPHQTSWPADFLATAEYSWDCPGHPCDDTFVAIQAKRGAPWKIDLFVTYSGPVVPVPVAAQSATGYLAQPGLDYAPNVYLQQYARYLDSIVGAGVPPKSTWLQPGPYTTGFVSLYQSPASQHADGYSERVEYVPGPAPTFTFFASNQPIMCGTVDYVDTETALPGQMLVQPPDRGNFGPTIAPGSYHQVVTRGIHMNCYTYLMTAPKRVWVLGDWRGRVPAAAVSGGGSAPSGSSAPAHQRSSSAGRSEPAWVGLTPPTSPPGRFWGSMAFDAQTHQLVLFGGGSCCGAYGDTWIWDGQSWTEAYPSTSPTDREQAVMAYDGATHQLILFGGQNRSGLLGDTWEWTGSNWRKLQPAESPSPRYGMSMTYDGATKQLVLFGGLVAGKTTYSGETWTWNGTVWSRQATSIHPSARYAASMAYDAQTDSMILFGGGQLEISSLTNDTWSWNGTAWTKLHPAESPPARGQAAITYVAKTGNILMFGGISTVGGELGDTWRWTGHTWAVASTTSSPEALLGASLAQDGATSQTILFGGGTGNPYQPQAGTWEWEPAP